MRAELIAQLNALRLYGMAQALADLVAYPAEQPPLPELWVQPLIDAERADRQARTLQYQLKTARFPLHRDLASFDFQESPVPEPRVRSLSSAQFTDTAQNLIFVGGTGTGKSHLAIALGVAAIHTGKRARFFNVVDLVNQLEREKQLGKAGILARQLTPIDVVILDELGYLPFIIHGWGLALPPVQPTLRKNLPDYHHQPQFWRMGAGVWRCQNDHRLTRPAHSPLRHPRNRQRLLPLQTAKEIRLIPWVILDAVSWILFNAD